MKKIFLLIFFLTACGVDNPPQIRGIQRSQAVQEAQEKPKQEPVEYTVLYRKESTNFSKYEPSDGTYLGAWLMPDMSVKMFEHITGNSHAVYAREMNLDDDIPNAWILQNIASFSTPLIIIHPPKSEEYSETDLLINLAQKLGSFNIPVFIVFYPAETETMMPAEYTLLFKQARNIFLSNAQNAAFVWAAPNYTATAQNPYYPGHSAVDWVGVSLLSTWDGEYKNILQDFEIFYDSFHEHKAIMILPLGISHYTKGDYVYRLQEAAGEIKNVYTMLQNFPRLRLIVYGDAITISRFYTDDFSISMENILANAYKAAVTGNFLSFLEKEPLANEMWVRAKENGFFYENSIYISNITLESELGITAPRQRRIIGEKYFTDSVKIPNKKITVCNTRKVIFIENMP